ncbi:MAG: hypothetical protein JW806_01195 [Sedimentisphaerales bacterium]|nr:hypothetical protein [Sedimentisphaerales bacterium]
MTEPKNSKRRQLIRKLNTVRRTQKQQIDILCNDILAAHGDFIKHLNNFRFTADFYENLLGAKNLASLSTAAAEFIAENIPDCNVAIIFSTSDAPHINFCLQDANLEDISSNISPQLTTQMIEAVCQSSKVCGADELCRIGFVAGPSVLKKISLAAIGLNNTGPALGMILLYRAAEKPFSRSELANVLSITKGLAKAVKALKLTDPCDSIT